jgi:hypothetical protein
MTHDCDQSRHFSNFYGALTASCSRVVRVQAGRFRFGENGASQGHRKIQTFFGGIVGQYGICGFTYCIVLWWIRDDELEIVWTIQKWMDA